MWHVTTCDVSFWATQSNANLCKFESVGASALGPEKECSKVKNLFCRFALIHVPFLPLGLMGPMGDITHP